MKLFIVFFALSAWAAAASADVKFIFGPDVSAAQQSKIAKATQRAEEELQNRYSFAPSPATVLIASGDTNFLAQQYCKLRGCGVARKKKAIEDWIFGEAFYRGVMINLSSKYARPAKNVENAITHELFHVFQYELVGSKSRRCCAQDRVSVVGPTWLMEGAADYFEKSMKRSALRQQLSHGKKNRRKLPNRSLQSIETRQGMNIVRDGYAIGAYATSLLVKRSGEASIAHFYKNVGRGQNWTTAFETSFGISVADFYADF